MYSNLISTLTSSSISQYNIRSSTFIYCDGKANLSLTVFVWCTVSPPINECTSRIHTNTNSNYNDCYYNYNKEALGYSTANFAGLFTAALSLLSIFYKMYWFYVLASDDT